MAERQWKISVTPHKRMIKFSALFEQYIGNFQSYELTFIVLIAVISFAESFAIIGYLTPGTILLYGAAIFAIKQNLIPQFLITATLSGFAADLMSYYLGQRGNAWFISHAKKYATLNEKIHFFFERYGTFTIIIGKISGTLRPLVSFIAGTSQMSFKKFFILVWIGNIITSALYLIIVYYFRKYAKVFHGGTLALGAMIIVLALAYLLIRQSTRPSSHPDLSHLKKD
jgi:membrane protein DedA with SNARE-associated domain